ncbi:transcriptional regulator [Bacillus phage Pascal]|uniref:Transcriptional regulator n=1 Tax=Bacillus phage Pascal TaxID=1540092 RepID=A0A0A0RNR0_9CAUD|nr:transcriptional regulator [Bacillus phage Pascal]AIW03662.1 transcriptional regulator [Bacillus phage Pascal]
MLYNILELREKAGMSQVELADKLGIDKSTVNRYEKGGRQPSVEMLYKISKVLNVSIDNLIKGVKENDGDN